MAPALRAVYRTGIEGMVARYCKCCARKSSVDVAAVERMHVDATKVSSRDAGLGAKPQLQPHTFGVGCLVMFLATPKPQPPNGSMHGSCNDVHSFPRWGDSTETLSHSPAVSSSTAPPAGDCHGTLVIAAFSPRVVGQVAASVPAAVCERHSAPQSHSHHHAS
jgi:hypothetical protein